MDFNWGVDRKGYSLADADPPYPFDAPVDDRPPLLSSSYHKPLRIVGRSGDMKKIRPLEGRQTVFANFADIASLEKDKLKFGVLDFVTRYGPLTEFGLNHYESVPDAIKHAQAIRSFIVAAGGQGRMANIVGPDGIQLSRINAAVVWDKKTKTPKFQLSPRSLLQALWMQLALALQSGIIARECPHCGVLFTAGPNTGRRGDSQFCSSDHQILSNSLKRSQPK